MYDFVIREPRRAKDFIHDFPPAHKRLGERFYHTGNVTDLEVKAKGTHYLATVRDDSQEIRKATLAFERQRGWTGWCSCGTGQCHHLYAAFKQLLAENSRSAVQALSSSGRDASAALAASRAQPEGPPSAVLHSALTKVLGRDLTTEERRYVARIVRAFQTYGRKAEVNPWMFSELGFRLGLPMWGTIAIWPERPVDDLEFWLYLANAVLSRGGSIPEFLEPVTDLTLIDAKFKRWQRKKEIDEWSQRLAHDRSQIDYETPEPAGETELRLVITKKDARLEGRAPGEENFRQLKSRELSDLAEDIETGVVRLGSAAEALWVSYTRGGLDLGVFHLEHLLPEQERALNRILRTPLLSDRVVTPKGQPLERSDQPLIWELVPAQGENDDYILRLVSADGKLAPGLLCELPGRPTLYLTETAVYRGAPLPDALDPSGENRIPAMALETAAGLAFLKSINVEVPPRMRDRVRLLPLAVVIECELCPNPYSLKQEQCLFTITAEAPDQTRRYWSGHNWVEEWNVKAKPPLRDGTIIGYDETLLRKTAERLRQFDLKPYRSPSTFFTRVTKKFPDAFVSWLQSLPREVDVRLAGELASLVSPDVAGSLKLEVTEHEIDWFDLKVVLDVSDTTLTQAEIKLLLNAKGGFVRLPGKGWRRLKYDLSEEEDERLARLGLNPRELTAEPQRLHALQLADPAASKLLPEEQVQQVQRRATEIKARVNPPLPAGIKAELRPYQLEGFHFLAYLSANRFGGILADDMGLGKTLQALAWLIWLRHEGLTERSGNHADSAPGGSAPSLVVCPKSVADNWHAEAGRFAPELRVRVWAPSDLPRLLEERAGADLHVINYSQLRMLGESLATAHWQAVILDEGQYIKNPTSQTAQIGRSLRADYRLILSGTPIENRLMDLWSLMAFAMPGVLGSRAQFGRLYDTKGDPFARRRLAARVRPFLLRRTKNQVARDLPDRVEEDLFCEIEGEQQDLYRAELKRARQRLLHVETQQELAEERFNFLASLLRLRQICCHPRLVKSDSSASSAKAEALLEQLEPLMEEGEKVLVFSQFVQLLHLLRPELEKAGWPVFYLTGETENRGDLVRQFQSAEGPAVFLISLKAGGFGLNLTAASYVVLFDPWWNPAVENQAIDRTHRIGQENKVNAYRLLIKNSIEEKIRTLQKQKKALAEDVLGEEKFAQSLTLDDLRFLFSE